MLAREYAGYNTFTSTPVGPKIQQLITYRVHSSFPLIEILDTINVEESANEVKFPADSKTNDLLQKAMTGPYSDDPANRYLPHKTFTCLGIKLIKR